MSFMAIGAGRAQHGVHKFTYKDARFNFILTMDSVLSPDSVNYDRIVKKITILDRKSKKVVQVITPPENATPVNLTADELFIIEDMNFDRFNDIRMVQFMPAGPNIPFYYWIYDTVSHKFLRNTPLEDITSP